MDPRRLLIAAPAMIAVSSGALSSCALLRDPPAAAAPEATARAPAGLQTAAAVPASVPAVGIVRPEAPPGDAGLAGRPAIAAANLAARARSREDGFVGGVQVFRWAPGRVFEVWAAPLRVTTLSLGAGETLVSKAAGDTVRWQIGEVASGAGAGRRVHILLKPIEAGLETNLILTTNRRIYLIELRSGEVEAFNAAVAWDEAGGDVGADAADGGLSGGHSAAPSEPPAVLHDGYRIDPRGRRPRWTPTAVFDDGRSTFIRFPADLQAHEAPVLFVIGADGAARMVNYRQAGEVYTVDRLFDRAELRLGGRRAEVVRIRRVAEGGR